MSRYEPKDDYIQIWKIDFTSRGNIELLGYKRNIDKERSIESTIKKILKDKFFYQFILTEHQIERVGSHGLESSLIGTVAGGKNCRPPNKWLGNHSPKKQIRESGLWLVQHLTANGINKGDRKVILNAIDQTKEWITTQI